MKKNKKHKFKKNSTAKVGDLEIDTKKIGIRVAKSIVTPQAHNRQNLINNLHEPESPNSL